MLIIYLFYLIQQNILNAFNAPVTSTYLLRQQNLNIIREKDKLITSVYRKPTFSGIYTHFDSFLPSSNKIGLLNILLYRCFRICSDWTKFHLELVNGYPENSINNCFKVSLDNKNRIQEKVITVPQKTLF